MITPMPEPTPAEIRAALTAHAYEETDGQWAFRTHPMNIYSETDALRLAKVNLMLGTRPNGSLGTTMLEAIVDRIAAVERELIAEA